MRLRALPILIISAILTIGILGIGGFGFINHGGQHVCPVPLMSGGECPPPGDGIALAVHYLSGMQNLFQSMVNPGVSVLALSILLAFAVLLISKPLHASPPLPPLFYRIRTASAESHCISKRQFLRWLALHCRRDPHSLRRVHGFI